MVYRPHEYLGFNTQASKFCLAHLTKYDQKLLKLPAFRREIGGEAIAPAGMAWKISCPPAMIVVIDHREGRPWIKKQQDERFFRRVVR